MKPAIRSRTLGSSLAAVLTAAGACMPEAPPAAAAQTDAPAAEMTSLTTVDLAVRVASAIRAAPAASDSILLAYGLSRAGLDSLMYVVASDSAMAREYTEAIRP